MLRDLLTEILNAKKIKEDWGEAKLAAMALDFKSDNKNNEIMWAYESGEEVCHFLINNERAAYIHVKLPICFYASNFEKYKKLYSGVLWFVKTEDFDKDEWFVDLKKMRELVPELSWCACVEAVNPKSFSVDGFRFATH